MTSATVSVLLVRHGRTALNAEGRIRGHADPELDSIGMQEATATARSLRRCGITEVVTSPLRRAVITGQIIAATCHVSLRVDAAFTDRDYGIWTGHVLTEVVERWGSVDAAPGVEPRASVLRRAFQALDALTNESDGGTIAVVTHDAVIRTLLTRVGPSLTPVVGTGSWAHLTRVGTGWRVVSIDNVGRT